MPTPDLALLCQHYHTEKHDESVRLNTFQVVIDNNSSSSMIILIVIDFIIIVV